MDLKVGLLLLLSIINVSKSEDFNEGKTLLGFNPNNNGHHRSRSKSSSSDDMYYKPSLQLPNYQNNNQHHPSSYACKPYIDECNSYIHQLKSKYSNCNPHNNNYNNNNNNCGTAISAFKAKLYELETNLASCLVSKRLCQSQYGGYSDSSDSGGGSCKIRLDVCIDKLKDCQISATCQDDLSRCHDDRVKCVTDLQNCTSFKEEVCNAYYGNIPGTIEFNKYKVYVSKNRRSWPAAAAACMKMGGVMWFPKSLSDVRKISDATNIDDFHVGIYACFSPQLLYNDVTPVSSIFSDQFLYQGDLEEPVLPHCMYSDGTDVIYKEGSCNESRHYFCKFPGLFQPSFLKNCPQYNNNNNYNTDDPYGGYYP